MIDPKWLFEQFGERPVHELWAALAAAYDTIAVDVVRIGQLVVANQQFTEENEALRLKLAEFATLPEENEKLREMVGVDHLTGLPNRYRVDEIVEAEVAYARRYYTPLSILFIDIDHFKDVNDGLGHDVGDAVLAALAQRFRETLRDYDVIGRHGGEEFLGVLRNNTLDQAVIAAERLRQAVADKPFEIGGHKLKITVSIGVAEWRRPELSAAMIRAADMAMYRAKHGGRNRVVANKR